MTLATLFADRGHSLRPRGGQPLVLEGDQVWRVRAGAVDLFLSRLDASRPVGALHPLGRREVGELLFGLPDDRPCRDWGLVALGNGDGELAGLSWPILADWEQDDAPFLAEALAEWGGFLGQSLVDGGVAGGIARHHVGAGLPAIEGGQSRASPLLRNPQPRSADSIGDESLLLPALWQTLVEQIQAQEAADLRRLEHKEAREASRLGEAMGRLAAILDTDNAMPAPTGAGSPLLRACRRLEPATGIQFLAPPEGIGSGDPLADIVEASRVRRRRIALKGEWWRRDGQAMLAFRRADAAPVALLPGVGGYRLTAPEGGPGQVVDAALAASLDGFAWAFYRSFGDALVGVVAMLRFGALGCGRDFLMILTMAVAIGLLGLVTPLATGMLFDTVIPGADRGQLLQLALALLSGALAASLFELARGFAMLRAEGRMDAAVQAAVWDRLLRLPTSFFRDYTAGDLAGRANGINAIRQTLSGHALQTLLAALFSALNLVLLFHYSVELALLALALVALAMLATAVAGFLTLRHERHLAEVAGRISGQVFQFLGGIAKLRASGAEGRAFFNWALNFGRQQEHLFRARMVGNALAVFNSLFPTLANMLIFAAIAFNLGDDQGFSTGDFMAFNAAFGGFLAAMLAATGTGMAILGIVPIYERARPILRTAPEIDAAKAHPGRLGGDIEISHLSFAYGPEGPAVLDDVNLHIRPGEFVAIVGASGSGKSTLLRLLLGFETPVRGSIRYDSQDLAGLDPGAVRRQLGVVLQNGQLMSGDLFGNIVGSAPLSLDDAWAAAEQAGLGDDIRAMPMGMHTVVSDGGDTLSGGQRQRLMIARAIVNRPRILFFDEATSALDNRTQATVSDSLERLRATRLVIAHRLSTIRHADRILVMDAGRIVQSGTYAELVESEGLFADLARRQLI